jgi:prepilin-type N-terminal cleavage/methylation domain-containing protein
MREHRAPRQGIQSGFSLAEFAIAMVIFGLLVGGIFQGIELLNSSRIQRSVADFQSISTAYVSYQDRYQQLPGDDGPLASLQERGGDWAVVTLAGNRDGELNVGLEETFSGGGEQAAFWQHLRAAGFVEGNPSLAGRESQPGNAFGGRIGITAASTHRDLAGLKLCMSLMPGKAASAMDLQLDDGAPRTGDFRASLSPRGQSIAPDNNNPPATYEEAEDYTICKRI